MTIEPLDFTPRGLLAAALATLRRPRDGVARVLNAQLPTAILWTMLAAVVAASVALGQGTLILATGGAALGNPYLANPLVMFLIQIGLLVVMVYAIHFIGRLMGGQGVFEDTLALVVWLQFVMACLQVVQTIALFVLPPVADVIGIVGLVVFIWLLTHFIATVHGFKSLGLVFGMILVSAFGITFAMSLILTMMGVVAPGDFNV
ncbi:YIP1 family protein [Rhodobacteraceae bacterium SC52]|nr:YIP1 family protein [Rhodobacteraceae bacterium SC52]